MALPKLENGGFQVGSMGWFEFQTERLMSIENESGRAEAVARLYLICSAYYNASAKILEGQ